MTPILSIVPVDFMHLLFQMRSRLKSWCQSTSRGSCLASCCCLNDKARRTSHLEKCQSFYTGLSQGGPGGSLGSTPGSVSGYPQLSSVKKSRTLGGPNGILTSGLSGNNIANTTSRVSNLFSLYLHISILIVLRVLLQHSI